MEDIILYTNSEGHFTAPMVRKLITSESNFYLKHVYISKNTKFNRKRTMFKRYAHLLPPYGLSFIDFLRAGVLLIYQQTIGRLRLEKLLKFHNISFSYLENINDESHISEVKSFGADKVVFFIFDQIAKKTYLESLRCECLNLHLGILPFYRGGNSLIFQMLHGEALIGSTLHKVVAKIDAGEIISVAYGHKSSHTWIDNMQHLLDISMSMLLDYLSSGKKVMLQTNGAFHVPAGSYFNIPTRDDLKKFYSSGNTFF